MNCRCALIPKKHDYAREIANEKLVFLALVFAWALWKFI